MFDLIPKNLEILYITENVFKYATITDISKAWRFDSPKVKK